jgi:hypothetical protein
MGIFLNTEANKEVRQKHETTSNKKLQEWTSTKRRSVTGGGLSIGEFYNNIFEPEPILCAAFELIATTPAL